MQKFVLLASSAILFMVSINLASSFSLFNDESEQHSVVTFHDVGTFVISSDDDYEDHEDGEELIHESLAALANDENKYKPLHAYVSQYNRPTVVESTNKNLKDFKRSSRVFRARSLKSKREDGDDDSSITTLKAQASTAESSTTTVYTNSENSTDSLETSTGEEPTAVDKFEKIEPEYETDQVDSIKSENVTFDVPEDEIRKSLMNIFKTALDIRKPKNCSAFEGFRYGFKAMQCAIAEFKWANTRPQFYRVLGRVWKIFKVWMCVYAFFAIPCWCHKGWCCCCFRCKFCFPREIITREKKYLAENPPGILRGEYQADASTETLKYEPTIFEKDAYEQFESAVRDI